MSARVRLTVEAIDGVTSLRIDGPVTAIIALSPAEDIEIELFDYTDKVVLHNKLLDQNMEDL